MEQHPRSDGAVEAAVRKSKVLHVPDLRFDAARSGELDHPLRLVDGDDRGVQLPAHPLRELALAAPDLEDPPRAELGDRLEDDIARVRPLRRGVGRFSSSEASLVRVLLADDRWVVQPQGSTIGAPGKPRTPDFPPSHRFTVAPTSPNSPSCRAPRAFRPST